MHKGHLAHVAHPGPHLRRHARPRSGGRRGDGANPTRQRSPPGAQLDSSGPGSGMFRRLSRAREETGAGEECRAGGKAKRRKACRIGGVVARRRGRVKRGARVQTAGVVIKLDLRGDSSQVLASSPSRHRPGFDTASKGGAGSRYYSRAVLNPDLRVSTTVSLSGTNPSAEPPCCVCPASASAVPSVVSAHPNYTIPHRNWAKTARRGWVLEGGAGPRSELGAGRGTRAWPAGGRRSTGGEMTF